eukprot:5447337-Amphidinium_carterae.1
MQHNLHKFLQRSALQRTKRLQSGRHGWIILMGASSSEHVLPVQQSKQGKKQGRSKEEARKKQGKKKGRSKEEARKKQGRNKEETRKKQGRSKEEARKINKA